MIYAKLSQQMLWHCHKNWFVRTILRIRLIQVYPKYREPDLKLCRILLEFSQWTEPVFMAMPKPLLTEFGIHHSLKSCTHDLKFSVVLQIFELNNKALITKTWHSLKYAPVSVFQESQIPFMRKCLASKQIKLYSGGALHMNLSCREIQDFCVVPRPGNFVSILSDSRIFLIRIIFREKESTWEPRHTPKKALVKRRLTCIKTYTKCFGC